MQLLSDLSYAIISIRVRLKYTRRLMSLAVVKTTNEVFVLKLFPALLIASECVCLKLI